MKRKHTNKTPKFSRRLDSDGSYTFVRSKSWGGKPTTKEDRLKTRLTLSDPRH